ncbi:profilin [Coniella lustricola]|uniref:Profilin n=1 Tax=Coniella lustricola TaxID=2025994 RepID=A0A2T3AJ74_9PEZI|nr:profilin [Coniella lustricola]
MSWQAYVDTSLVGTGHVDKAAIISIAGDSAWATSAGYTISAEEMKNISGIVSGNQAAVDKAFAEGLYVAGERYVLTKNDEGSVYARKGREGLVISKSKQAILIGHHGEAGVAGNATQVVESLKDYLVGLNY